jgi:hypothetical protein
MYANLAKAEGFIMSRVDQSGLAGRTRDKPIVGELERILDQAAIAAGVDRVWVYSGGQPGTTGRRTGSTRHDGGRAADLQLIVDGRRLSFTNSSAPRIVRSFITEVAKLRATGIGAATDYMGPSSFHVGFGLTPQDHRRIVWGRRGASANAPAWLRNAASAGWGAMMNLVHEPPAPEIRMVGPHEVIARSGLNLRKGPGEQFSISNVLPAGSIALVMGYHQQAPEWAIVDLSGDGLADGFLFADYLRPLEDTNEPDSPDS